MKTGVLYRLEVLNDGFFAGFSPDSSSDSEWVDVTNNSFLIYHSVEVPYLNKVGNVVIRLKGLDFLSSAKFHRWTKKYWISINVETDGCIYMYGFDKRDSSGPSFAILLNYEVL